MLFIHSNNTKNQLTWANKRFGSPSWTHLKNYTNSTQQHTRSHEQSNLKDSIRIILALVADFDFELQQMDVKTIFLNGELEEEVFMKEPERFY